MMNQPATYPRKANFSDNEFKSDPMNSTYRWELYLTPGHPMNKVPLMDGYSKGKGFENTNKIELLYKKLVNPILPYLSRCDTIAIYEQTKGLPKPFHTKLLELYPHNFAAFSWVKETAPIMDFLTLFYTEYLRTGKIPPIEDRRKNVRQPVYFADLDHSRYNFETKDELIHFCKSKIEQYSAQCMNIWYYKHADFQPELFEIDNSAELRHAINTAPNVEAAEAAQASLLAMHSKFTTKPN